MRYSHGSAEGPGMLSYGRPTVDEILTLSRSQNELLAIIAGEESGRKNRSQVQSCGTPTMHEVRPREATAFRDAPGKGVVATIEGVAVVVGRVPFLAKHGLQLAAASSIDEAMTVGLVALERSPPVVCAGVGGRVIGALALHDTTRPGSASAIRRLRERGMRSVMLTGDGKAVADAVSCSRDLPLRRLEVKL